MQILTPRYFSLVGAISRFRKRLPEGKAHYQSTSDLRWHKTAAWLHKNKPAAWRGRGKHWGPKGSQSWQRHPPMGGWLAGGTRPSLLHPWWICPHNRSVGRPMSWGFCSLQGLAHCRSCLVGPVALSRANVLIVWPPFQRICRLLISGSARRRRALVFPSGSFRPPCPVSNRPHVPYRVWLIRRAKGGNVLVVPSRVRTVA